MIVKNINIIKPKTDVRWSVMRLDGRVCFQHRKERVSEGCGTHVQRVCFHQLGCQRTMLCEERAAYASLLVRVPIPATLVQGASLSFSFCIIIGLRVHGNQVSVFLENGFSVVDKAFELKVLKRVERLGGEPLP